jgi:hypothetical protein
MEFSGADTVVVGQEGDAGQVTVDLLSTLLPKSFKL